jgi:transposase
MSRRWTDAEIRFMEQHYRQDMTPRQVAEKLKRSRKSIGSFAKTHRLTKCRLISAADRAYCLQAWKNGRSSVEIAAALGRSYSSISQLKERLGLTSKQPDFGPKFQAFVRKQNAAGWSDAQIAEEYGCERHTIGYWRARLKLPKVLHSAHQRQRVAARTREQCRTAGVRSLAEIRRLAFRKYARKAGLPDDLLPRDVQIFNFLLKNGPQTRRAICDGIGVPWKGSRQSLHSNHQEGSSLAHMMKRGMVVDLGRVVKRSGKGKSVHLYSVPLPVAEQIVQQRSAHAQEHAA